MDSRGDKRVADDWRAEARARDRHEPVRTAHRSDSRATYTKPPSATSTYKSTNCLRDIHGRMREGKYKPRGWRETRRNSAMMNDCCDLRRSVESIYPGRALAGTRFRLPYCYGFCCWRCCRAMGRDFIPHVREDRTGILTRLPCVQRYMLSRYDSILVLLFRRKIPGPLAQRPGRG